MTATPTLSIERDAWLAQALGRDAFRVSLPAGAAVRREAFQAPGFYTAKVPTERVADVKALAAAGFAVVDVAMVFERAAEALPADDAVTVRPAAVADGAAVLDIAGACFIYSRFHLDPLVPRPSADAVKRAWARDCLAGTRGDAVWVAESEGRTAGFLAQMTLTEGDRRVRVIDLIGVAPSLARRGIGRALVRRFISAAAGARVERLRVGTQAANIPSIRLYESCGFRAAGSHYVLHAHAGGRP